MLKHARSCTFLPLFLGVALSGSTASAQQVPVEGWLRGLAAAQKFELVVGKGMGGVMVTPPAVPTPQAVGDALAKAGVPFGFTTSKDGSRILILQLGIDALSKSVGIASGGAGAGSDSAGTATANNVGADLGERAGRGGRGEAEIEEPKVVEDPNDPRLQSKPALPPGPDADDPIEAFIDRSIKPLPPQIDMNDPDEAQVDPNRKALPPQIDYNDPDERRTPPLDPKAPAPKPRTPVPAEKQTPAPKLPPIR